MKILTIIIIAAALSGCAIPIPPSGDRMGEYGTINIGVKYTPSEKTAGYVSDIFGDSKTIKKEVK